MVPRTDDSQKREDDRARRIAAKVGLSALRTKGRKGAEDGRTGFSLFDQVGCCVAGENYSLSALEVIQYCNRIP